jgi:hypothetical protein
MNNVLEFIGLLFLIIFFTFPLWINKNYQSIFKKELNYNIKSLNNKIKLEIIQKKICTEEQPFKIDDKLSIVCNFPCNGLCQLKNYKNENL